MAYFLELGGVRGVLKGAAMPRGAVGGATAALIDALAEQGVRVLPYQIERWRAAGDLPRPVRHGLGRGRGAYSEPPDEATVQKAMLLAKASRRGSRRLGSHPVERLALGLPVSDEAARQAIDETFAEIGRVFGADMGDGDEAWQIRHDIARSVPTVMPVRWQDLLDAVDNKPARPEPARGRLRAAFSGLVHAIGGGGEAVPEDLIEMLAVLGDLPDDVVEQMHSDQREAELRGEQGWERAIEQMSIRHLRREAHSIDLERWRRALSVFLQVVNYQMMVVLFGRVAIVGKPVDLGEHLRINTEVVRRLQADPMWHVVGQYRLSIQPRRRVQEITLGAMTIIVTGQIDTWQEYLKRLLDIIHPTQRPGPTD